MNPAENSTKKVIARFAPSPTGYLHIGGVRSALFNYFFARQQGGKFLLRIEDTDKERSTKEYDDALIDAFDWLGIGFDEVHRQSERTDVYTKYIEKMIANGYAYVSEEQYSDEDITKAKQEGRELRDTVIRFKNPNKTIVYQDMILGEVAMDTADLGDFVIAKDLDTPIFHLVNVIDDYEMGVTHVIRGQEHVPNVPRQILIAEAIGASRFIYAHIPFILGPDGKKKLSKRDGGTALRDYQVQGYLKEALINFLSFIGWNPGGERELYSLDELVEAFDINKVQKGPAGFSLDKLRWFNRQYLQQLSDQDFFKGILPFAGGMKTLPGYSEEIFRAMIPAIRERLDVYGDIQNNIDAGEYDYYFVPPTYEAEKLIWKKGTKEDTIKHLEAVGSMVSSVTDWTADNIKSAIWDYAEEHGRGDVLWPLRYALSGRDKSPDPFTLAAVLGQAETARRIQSALELIQ
jgi:glutamyl-tRNA synthetase